MKRYFYYYFLDKMSDKVRTKLDKTGEVKAYSQTAMANNHAVIDYCRTSMAALSGSTAGILGLPTLYGFGFYAVSVFVLWLLMLWKAGVNWKKYFGSRQQLLTNGFFGQMFTYVLFWTFLYGMVHVY
ncbi:ER membrane protein complex subunit 6 [Eurytemora carolleeae]|uniref:ER membrane protein complex subunit 6 n=1 Tax=Eurytemora carolleeae TaxID=1294199 RepID=UPI000C78FF6B|nr:ER membrane protein complex subunit 6 [Eurytemora carolleeae]|eukprot:XP_023330406.1 ER membrane protein complex subunit 6-like [Eurytemora affinis]